MDYMQMDYMCGRLKEEDDRPPPQFPRETKEEKKGKAREPPGEP